MMHNINLEILECAYVDHDKMIQDLNTKSLVPKMVIRRRLTRGAKIAIYLTSLIDYDHSCRIVFGTNYGELLSTANILNSINNKDDISPTLFQNSVYNTAISYLSILTKNTNEIMTISSGDKTSLAVLKAGAIKALDGDILYLLAIESLNIDKIEDLNSCIDILETGVILKVKTTLDKETLSYDKITSKINYPKSIQSMINIAQNFRPNQQNIISVKL
jgi:hypothetical protein